MDNVYIEIDQPCQTNSMMACVELNYFDSVINTSRVPSHMTSANILPYIS